MDTIREITDKVRNTSILINTDDKNRLYLYLLDYIKLNCKIVEVEIDTNIMIEYIGDFGGLLNYINTNRSFDYINLLLNDYQSFNEYNGDKTTIKILDELDSNIIYIREKIN